MQGLGTAYGHHGEIIQGVFERDARALVRGLVSLPCRALKSIATFESADQREVIVTPSWKTKAKAAVSGFLESRAIPKGGSVDINSNIQIGYGLGSSTADVIASLRAVASCHNIPLSAVEIARLAVQAEKACDSTMFDGHAVLFAQREGVVIESLSGNIPPLDIVSVNVARNKPVDTLMFPPARYSSNEIEHFRALRGFLRAAIRLGNAPLLARVATASAIINQRYLPQPYFSEVKRIAEKCGSLGIQVAHSGTVIGLMFDPRDPQSSKSISVALVDLTSLGLTPQLYRQ